MSKGVPELEDKGYTDVDENDEGKVRYQQKKKAKSKKVKGELFALNVSPAAVYTSFQAKVS